MPKDSVNYNDEVTLVEFLVTLWNGKWLIVLCVSISSILGYTYAQMITPVYRVSAFLTPTIFSVSTSQLCEESADQYCLLSLSSDRIAQKLGGKWSAKDKELTFDVEQASSVEEYVLLLSKLEEQIATEILDESYLELDLLEGEISAKMLGTERLATNVFNAKRNIEFISEGHPVFLFSNVSVSKVQPKDNIITFLSFLFGGTLAVLGLLVRNAIITREEG